MNIADINEIDKLGVKSLTLQEIDKLNDHIHLYEEFIANCTDSNYDPLYMWHLLGCDTSKIGAW